MQPATHSCSLVPKHRAQFFFSVCLALPLFYLTITGCHFPVELYIVGPNISRCFRFSLEVFLCDTSRRMRGLESWIHAFLTSALHGSDSQSPESQYPLNSRLMHPRPVRTFRIILFILLNIKPRSLGRPACTVVTTVTELSRL
jgi:hypothetical protein